MDDNVKFPTPGDAVPAARPSLDMIEFLANRRSASAALLEEPGPSIDALHGLLQIASRVPDHRKMAPFRFIVIEKESRDAWADALVAAAAQGEENADALGEDKVRMQAHRAPTLICVVSAVDPAHKTPVWEQQLTAGLVCYNLLLAASAAGFAGQWLSEWMAYDAQVGKQLGLSENERVAGFVYLGTATQDPLERQRPDSRAKTTIWSPNA